ncbi:MULTISPECIES: signal recognition particle-docking protein FtsY [unclassified Haladaptatus]|uniref:signal recognition particle-docking protein FtsY n=1 Tax=unclassified Haladaptatus TaxID=2622732 RepID=UPI0023E8E1C3|nr:MULTISPECIES: signal recognition particle-docking protein FtsY [unclassified Haladaptatus]
MFDGLKEKLSSFRKDVEESAEVEEDVDDSPAADTESAADPATAEADAVEAEPEAPAEAAPDAAPTETPEPAPEPVADEPDSADPTETVPAEVPETTDEVEPEASAEAEPETDEGDVQEAEAAGDETDPEKADNGRSFTERAKLFATGRVVIEEEDLEDPLWNLEMALIQSDVEMNVAEEILDRIKEKLVGETRVRGQSTGDIVEEALHDALYDVISVGQFDFDQRVRDADKPVVIIFTGVNGVGKTTSIAKLSKYFEKQGLSTVLANGDTYRAGANEQLAEHARRLDKKIITHDQGSDPTAVIYDAVEFAKANDVDVVLGDTAGRLHTNNDLMAQLEKIDRVVGPDMTIFVDEAVAGQDAVERARTFNNAAAIDGAILTKADADSNGGAAISIAHVTGKPILFLGVGQGYDDLERFDPEQMLERLLGEE